MKVGVLALQGGFREHKIILECLGVECSEVRLPCHLEGLDSLIIPGGESTTIAKLSMEFGLVDPLRYFASQNKPIWGTCAGAIFMSKNPGTEQIVLGLINIKVDRNAFGRQIDSFETNVNLCLNNKKFKQETEGLSGLFRGVFIRAPVIASVGLEVDVLGRLSTGEIVAVREGNCLATVFHPELTDDSRIHEYFLGIGN